jgi:hypothetical protein
VDRFHTFFTFGAVLPCSWAPLDPGWTKKSTKHTKLKVVFTFCTLADTFNAAYNFCLIPSMAEMLQFEPYVELRDFHSDGIPHRKVHNFCLVPISSSESMQRKKYAPDGWTTLKPYTISARLCCLRRTRHPPPRQNLSLRRNMNTRAPCQSMTSSRRWIV